MLLFCYLSALYIYATEAMWIVSRDGVSSRGYNARVFPNLMRQSMTC